MIFLFLDVNPNIASHRLRLLPFQKVISDTGNESQTLIIFKTKFLFFRAVSFLINYFRLLKADFLIASKPATDKKTYRFIKIAKILGKKIIIDMSDNHLLNKNLGEKNTFSLLNILQLADFITVPTVKLRDSLPDKFHFKIHIIEDALDELCLPESSYDENFHKLKVLWFGHAGWAKIRPGPSESLKLFISYMSYPLFKEIHSNNKTLEFYIVSNDAEQVRDYITKAGVTEKIFISSWSIDAMKKNLSECNLVFIPYGNTNDLDTTKSSNRLELAVLARKSVLTNRFFTHWDQTLRDYIYELKDDTTLFDIKRYMASVKDNHTDAFKYLGDKQNNIIAGWVRLIDESVRYKM